MINAEQRPMYRFLMVLTAASMIGLQGYSVLFNNFAVETVGLEGSHVGIIQSVREVPGFLALLAVFVLLVMKEHRLSAVSIALLGFGVALTGMFPSYAGVAFTTLVMSFGFHYYETTNQSLTLQYFSTGVTPLVLGRVRSIAAISSVASAGLIWFLGGFMGYREIFLLIGGIVMLLGLWGAFQDPTHDDVPPQRKEMVLRKRYWLYYFLTFMSGARRQIFMVFSMFLLVKVFHCSVREVTLLFIVNNAINLFLNPLIGRAIIAFGERALCSVEYIVLIVVFAGYATTGSALVAGGLFVIDGLFFTLTLAQRTYFQKIADPADIAPSTAVGFTINHIAAVFLPALGGYLWMIDYRIPFIAGAVLGVVSLAAAQLIRVPEEVEDVVPLPVYVAAEVE